MDGWGESLELVEEKALELVGIKEPSAGWGEGTGAGSYRRAKHC